MPGSTACATGDAGRRPGPGRGGRDLPCTAPSTVVRYLRDYREVFRPGSLVTDVCGIKTAIMKAAQVLPPRWILSAATPWRALSSPA